MLIKKIDFLNLVLKELCVKKPKIIHFLSLYTILFIVVWWIVVGDYVNNGDGDNKTKQVSRSHQWVIKALSIAQSQCVVGRSAVCQASAYRTEWARGLLSATTSL